MGNHLAFFDFGSKVCYFIVVEVDLAVFHLAVGCLDEAEVVDFRIYAQR